MNNQGRPSLDMLIPLVMIESDTSDENDENMCTDSQKDILRYFESGDLVLVRIDTNCSPAIVFSASGLVMKIDIDRQLYHVCLLDEQLTEKWIDANDMVTYSVPMIAQCDEPETVAMWSAANELLAIPNTNENRARLDEFRRRFDQMKEKRTSTSTIPKQIVEKRKKTPSIADHNIKNYSSELTTCEELAIVESIRRISPSSFDQARRVAEEAFRMIICTNNRETVPLFQIEIRQENWFITFIARHIDQLRQYSNAWLVDLQKMYNQMETNNSLSSLISLIKNSS